MSWDVRNQAVIAAEPPSAAAKRAPYARENLVAWCIVPFDAKKRGPAERAEMVQKLGLSKVAYDWRDEHVATFEQEILEYQKRGIEYFAFWGVHDEAFRLFEKYKLHPQIWLTPPNPTGATRDEQIQKSAASLMPVVERTAKAGLQLGLYNHGGWGGEPENLVAVCEYLRTKHQAKHVGIVYNQHHGHDHIARFPAALQAMRPYLLCLNINGMNREGDRKGQKILPLGAGSEDVTLLRIIRDSGYQGPIGVIGHTQDDVELRLRDNLDGLDWLLPQVQGAAPGPAPKYRTPVPAAALPAAKPAVSAAPAQPSLRPGKFGQALDAAVAGLAVQAVDELRSAPITVECWAKLTNKAGFQILAASEPKSSPSHWEMYSYAGSGFFSVYMPGRGGEYRSNVDIADGQWHHVAMVYESTRLRLFVDGKLAHDAKLPPAPEPRTSQDARTSIAIGRLVEGGIGCAGLIDELRIRRGAHAIESLPVEPPALDDSTVGLWRFDALIEKTKVKDESSRGVMAVAAMDDASQRPAANSTAAKTASGKPKVPEHWGKGQVGFEGWEEDWVDRRWQEAEVGDWLGAIVALPQGPYRKAINIRVGDERQATVSFDTQYLALRAAWRGFLEFNPTRFGIIGAPKPQGEVFFTMPEKNGWSGEKLQYRGMETNGRRVVLRYDVDGVAVRESPWIESSSNGLVVTRAIEIAPTTHSLQCLLLDAPESGAGPSIRLSLVGGPSSWLESKIENGRRRDTLTLPAHDSPIRITVRYVTGTDAQAKSDLPRNTADASLNLAESLDPIAAPGAPRWTETIETAVRIAKSDGSPYVVDSIDLPFENPYRALLFTSGHDFLSDGDIVVCTVHGDVWRVQVKGLAEASGKATGGKATSSMELKARWRRIATGLHQPLGLVVRRATEGDSIFVLGRDQITRLRDRNRDGEMDAYECFSNAYPTSAGGHDYITCLERDDVGQFYFAHANLGIVRVSADGQRHEVLSTGLRNPNGLGLAPGSVVTAAPQEGDWTPASAIFVSHRGAHFGGGGPRVTEARPLGYDPPLVWIPRRVDNSSGGQTWVTSDRWGPLAGYMLHFSFGQCSMMLVGDDALRDQTLDKSNAVSVKRSMVGANKPDSAFLMEFPFRFDSGAMRGRFSPHDGQLYVTGLRGWTSAASRDGCLQRVRYTGAPLDLPVSVKTYQNGVSIAFTEPLDRTTAEQPGNYHVEQWNYRYSQTYGSPEYRLSDPKLEGRDLVRVRSATLLDERTVFLELKDPQPVNVMAISCAVRSASVNEQTPGREIRRTIYQTIHRVSDQRIEEDRLARKTTPGNLNDLEEDALQPGLIARFVSETSETGSDQPSNGSLNLTKASSSWLDHRVDRMAAIMVPSRTAPAALVPAGPFRVRWEGYVRLPLPLKARFFAECDGAAAVMVNDTRVELAFTTGKPGKTTESAGVTNEVSLQGGLNKLVVEYRSPPARAARFRLFWESAEFAREPLPPSVLFHSADDGQLQDATTLRRGRALFESLRCLACHSSSESATPVELRYDAPNLSSVASYRDEWLVERLRWSEREKTGSDAGETLRRMPHWRLTDDEARDIVAWLRANVPSSSMEDAGVEQPTEEMKAQGATLYENWGCAVCHTFEAKADDAYGRRWLGGVREKYLSVTQLAAFLRSPHKFHPTSRMPDFQPDEQSAIALAGYLIERTESPNRPASAASNKARSAAAVERGGRLALERGCLQCHGMGEKKAEPRADSIPLVDLASPRGCLSVSRHTNPLTPWYSVSPADRAALQRYVVALRGDADLSQRSALAEASRSLVESLRCASCHDRDSARSARGRILVDESERGLAPEPLPNLTWAGEKLQAHWTGQFLRGEQREERLRPWLKGRMPSFSFHAETLAQGMAAEHGVDDKAPPPFPVDLQLASLGDQLTQRSALDCRQCHAVGNQPAQGDDQTKIAPGINFVRVKSRLRHEYYSRFTLDPPRFDVSTKMPKLAPDGRKTKVVQFLEGDARAQFEAIWHFLQNQK